MITTINTFQEFFVAVAVKLSLPVKKVLGGAVIFCTMFFGSVNLYAGDGGITDPTVTQFITNANLGDPLNTVSWTGSAVAQYIDGAEASEKILNVVTFKIYEETPEIITADFTATVKVLIEYGDNASSLQSVTKIFTVNYTKGDVEKKYTAQQYYSFQDAKYVRVTLIDDTNDENPVTVLPTVGTVNSRRLLVVENKLIATRFYDHLAPGVQANVTIPASLSSDADKLLVGWSWPALALNNYTQLEWAWLETGTEVLYLNQSNLFDYDRLFRSNSTRLDLPNDKSGYNIPMLYDGTGTLYVRVRPVLIINDNRIDGAWSTAASCTFGGHEPDLNWQSTTSYAEEGKSKTVISYFDGSLRSRQTVTKENSTNKVITAETFYDGQGRPALQILPAPSMSGIIKYREDLNLFNGQVVAGSASTFTHNPADIFDLEPISSPGQLTLDNSVPGSASNYYSPAGLTMSPDHFDNPNVPDAEGYPYTLTRFTPDGSGRIMAQSGVGPNHAIGSGRETRYFYGLPAQEELDALFGTEAGNRTHYSKNMVQDANGQMSVNYVDIYGRTVATALAGAAPDGIAKLDNGEPGNPGINYPNQQGSSISISLLDNTTNIIKNNSVIESVNNLLVPVEQIYTFKYKLTPDVLVQANCVGAPVQNLCYTCLYDLEIAIVDESGVNASTIKKYTNISLSSITDVCNGPAANFNYVPGNDALPEDITSPNTISFEKKLFVGSYSIRKTLSLNEHSLQLYKDLYSTKADCKTLEQYINEVQTLLESSTNCAAGPLDACSFCNDEFGNPIYPEDGLDQYISNYATEIGIPVTSLSDALKNEITALFEANKRKCEMICNTISHALPTIRDQMLADMKPYTGQYALDPDLQVTGGVDEPQQPDLTGSMYQKYNIFATSTAIPAIALQPFFRHPLKQSGTTIVPDEYRDQQGNVDVSFYPDPLSGSILPVIAPTAFAQQFSDSWLKSLLPHHPEYQKLLYAEQHLAPSYNWISKFNEANLGTALLTTGDEQHLFDLIHPVAHDPFFVDVAPGLAGTMETTIANYRGSNVGMWQIAWGHVGCRTIQDPVLRQACYTTELNELNLPLPNAGFTAAQNEEAWQVFRGLYSAERERMVNEYIAAHAPANSDETALIDQHYHVWFPSNNTNLAQQNGWESWTPANPGDPPPAVPTVPDLPATPQQQYTSHCDGYISMWKNRLLKCAALANHANSEAIITQITNRMKVVCINGSDEANPYGSSNVKTALNNDPSVSDKNFEAIIKSVFIQYNIINAAGDYTDNFCNPFVIDWPKPYGKGPKLMANIPATVIGDCGCDQFKKMKAEASAHNYNPNSLTSLNQYLQATYSEVLSQNVYNALIQCPDTECQECDKLFAMVDAFNIAYPDGAMGCPPADPLLTVSGRTNNQPTNYTASEEIEFVVGFESGYLDRFETYISPNLHCDNRENCEEIFVDFFNTYNHFENDPKDYHYVYNQFKSNCGGWPSVCGNQDFRCESLKRVECSFINRGYESPGITIQAAFAEYFNNYFHLEEPIDDWNVLNGMYTAYGCDMNLLDHISGTLPAPCLVCTETFGPIVLDTPEPLPDFLSCGFTGNAHCINCAQLSIYTAEFKQKFTAPSDGAPYFNSNAILTPEQVSYNQSFARFINYRTGFQYEWTTYALNAANAQCILANYASNTGETQNVICGNPLPINDPHIFIPDDPDPCEDVRIKAIAIGQQLYQTEHIRKLQELEAAYRAKCLAAKDVETFTATYINSEYHYTLYYYDMAANLLKTVPPKGVQPIYNTPVNGPVIIEQATTAVNIVGTDFHQSVKTSRLNGYDAKYVPAHQFVTNYRYNSLNQVIAQSTPDGGESRFWYDELGRLVISQNAKQWPNKYSYTFYDALGRITNVGQITNADQMLQNISFNKTALQNWIDDGLHTKEQVTRTTYDVACPTVNPPPYPGVIQQKNLRNRVSFTQYFDSDPDDYAATPNAPEYQHYTHATFYSYDVHGNVDVLLQDYKSLGAMSGAGNRFKKLTYDFDLISGKVNEVNYQDKAADAFYHRYSYDDDNRLTMVETSRDKIVWEKDARYRYYRHGPLSRMLLGELQVQGLDYAYTLQGWLKGVNSTSLNVAQDIGKDGYTGSGVPLSTIAKDVIGFALHYYDLGNNVLDYKPVGGASVNSFARPVAGIALQSLYNGNIAGISMNNGGLARGVTNTSNAVKADPLFYKYGYDQLNRLVDMRAYAGLDIAANTWTNSVAINDYKEHISYDPNGNIYSYDRNGVTGVTPPSGTTGGLAMDQLSYKYYYYSGATKLVYDPATGVPAGGRGTNQLARVRDLVANDNVVGDDPSSSKYKDDIDDQVHTDNYVYDAIGNLIEDKAEGITIDWNIYGKIRHIEKTKTVNSSPVTTNINYTYDPSGNRISKHVVITGATGSDKTTIYVRDASGNVMSVYESGVTAQNNGQLTQTEAHIYGSSRLGILSLNTNVQTIVSNPENITNFTRGIKFFELTNHLGNVLATVSDRRMQVANTTDAAAVASYEADVVTASDYYPFGMLMPGRKFDAGTGYRYGFNGKENDDEVKGEGNQQDYGMRIYDGRIGRFLSRDPLVFTFPYYTPYQFAGNKPIWCIDLDGCEDSTATIKLSSFEVFKFWNKSSSPPIVGGTTNGVATSLYKTWGFVTSDMWKASTWKAAGQFLEQGAFSMSSVKVAETPMVDAKVDEFVGEVVNGDTYSRSNYFSEFGTNIFTGYIGSKGFGVLKDLAIGKTLFKGLGSLRNPAITPGFGEMNLIGYGGGLASRLLSRFTNVIRGKVGEAATKYLWTIDNRGINIALEQTPAATARGFITHTNISSMASAGGEVWFTGEKSVFINAKSARFGGASMTAEQWSSAKAAWEKIGYKVESADFKPPTN